MSNWDKFNAANKILIEVDDEPAYYDPETGAIFSLVMFQNGKTYHDIEIYRTGRNVVKFKVDGASHRAMDMIYKAIHGVLLKGFKGYPKNGNFADLRVDNIIMVRTREAMFE